MEVSRQQYGSRESLQDAYSCVNSIEDRANRGRDISGSRTELVNLEKTLNNEIEITLAQNNINVNDLDIIGRLQTIVKNLLSFTIDNSDKLPCESGKIATCESGTIAACESAKIAERINLDNSGKSVTKENIENFVKRGGVIQVLQENQVIPLSRSDRYIVGCTSGVNRSQTHAAYLRKEGVKVDGILAGGSSAFNPAATDPMLSDLYTRGEEEEKAFYQQFGSRKCVQIGPEIQWQFDDIAKSVAYYKKFVNELQPTHFIAYAASGQSVVHRLLEKPGTLKGFKLTYIDWADEIAHPPADIKSYSQDAYALFENAIRKQFPIVD